MLYNMVEISHLQEWVASCIDVEMGHMFVVRRWHVYQDKYGDIIKVAPRPVQLCVDTAPMEASAVNEVELDKAEKRCRLLST
jgi:thymidylate synthase